jgi:hypothetical protein
MYFHINVITATWWSDFTNITWRIHEILVQLEKKMFWLAGFHNISCQFLPLLCRIWGFHSGGYEEYHFLDITPCSPLSVNQRFGGTYSLHLQGQRWRQYVPPKRRLTLNRLHIVISQKMVRFFLYSWSTFHHSYKMPKYSIPYVTVLNQYLSLIFKLNAWSS